MGNLEKTRAEEEASETLSSLCCDLKNFLAVVSGNTQFLAELSRQEVGEQATCQDQLIASTEDIQEASTQMTDLLHRLSRLCEALGEPCESDSEKGSFEKGRLKKGRFKEDPLEEDF